jgi:hypothetical protein
LHGRLTFLRQNGQLIAIITQIYQLFLWRRPGSGGRPLGYEKHAERAKNYPSQPIFQNKPPWRKDRQRYALQLTVFWFRLACISKKTVRNTVKLSAINGSNLLNAFLITFVFQSVMRPVRQI